MGNLKYLILVLTLTGCTVYKIVPDDKVSRGVASLEKLSITKVNEWPGGNHCFEPMLYVFSLGIIPTHCVDTYKVSSSSEEIGNVKVTTMQGWFPLLMVPLPSWQYSVETDVEPKVKEYVSVAE